jgi:ubiquinone/menaquinone biosynthesis C-methylase UbiE
MHLFDPKKLKTLDDPQRLQEIAPDKIVAALQLKPGQHLADIGSGTGLFSFALAPYVHPHGTVTGFDIQPECFEYAQDKLKQSSVAGLRFVLSAPEHIPATTGSMDAAIMILVAHEIPQPELFYPELARIMKTGAPVAIVEWLPEATPKGPAVEERIAPTALAEQLRKYSLTVLHHSPINENHYLLIAKNNGNT